MSQKAHSPYQAREPSPTQGITGTYRRDQCPPAEQEEAGEAIPPCAAGTPVQSESEAVEGVGVQGARNQRRVGTGGC